LTAWRKQNTLTGEFGEFLSRSNCQMQTLFWE
jgi:hypothetical protein